MEQLIAAVMEAMQEAGFSCTQALPMMTQPHLDAPVTAVSMESARAEAGAVFHYLGIREDPETGPRELYGRKLEATVLLDTFSPMRAGSSGCRVRTQALMELFLQGIAGVQIRDIGMEACRFDPRTNCFRQVLRLPVCAWLYALADEDGETFTDFTLKGDWK